MPVHARLRRGVVRADDAAELRRDGRDIEDQPAPPRRPHPGSTAWVIRNADVRLIAIVLVPLGFVHPIDRGGRADARVVDEDGDARRAQLDTRASIAAMSSGGCDTWRGW